jgi:4-hydroxy-3-methylbut-2-enyl diphosphate reductase
MTKRILLASPRGFCAGVDRAIEIVERALVKFGSPVYVRHEIVHNRYVVQQLRDLGAVFVEDLDEVPAGSPVIFSAHGVSENVFQEAAARGLTVIDAACPLVKKVHLSVKRHSGQGSRVVLIGHQGHPEVVGTMGQLPEGEVLLVGSIEDVAELRVEEGEQLAYTTQTTLSVDETKGIIEELGRRFPGIRGPARGDLCYATTNRQAAIHDMASEVDVLLVIGSRTSSNTNRLRELGERLGIPSFLLDSAEEADPAWFRDAATIGITSGASAPESLVQGLVERIQALHPGAVVETWPGAQESVHFPLPSALA